MSCYRALYLSFTFTSCLVFQKDCVGKNTVSWQPDYNSGNRLACSGRLLMKSLNICPPAFEPVGKQNVVLEYVLYRNPKMMFKGSCSCKQWHFLQVQRARYVTGDPFIGQEDADVGVVVSELVQCSAVSDKALWLLWSPLLSDLDFQLGNRQL